jgi:23S rRNA (cytidine1920-2'-O)/16S rRNA (cytidine1409-2'-O)-methyltransferase
MRLDQYLAHHHALTRNKAQQLIATDLITVNQRICNKSSQSIGEDDIVTIREDRRVHWVSRSAEKLAGFLESLNTPIAISGSNCLDIGSSTGGFTQVLLSLGAHHVDAVDVGTDQLHESLRLDTRVSSYEQTDIRDFSKNNTRSQYDIIVCDASFISLTEIIDPILALANENTMIILLYKPQFEVSREHLRKTGVPKEQSIVDKKMIEFESLLLSKDCVLLDRKASSLMGEAGNQEWIYMIQKNPQK